MDWEFFTISFSTQGFYNSFTVNFALLLYTVASLLDKPRRSMISAVVRGTEQKLTISLCLLDNDTFGVSECLSWVSKSFSVVSKSVPECLSRVSESFSEVSWSVPECLSRVSWSVSECLSPVLWSSTWLLFSSTSLLFCSTWLLSWLLSPSTWLLSSLQTVMTNSCALSLFVNVTLISSSSYRQVKLMPISKCISQNFRKWFKYGLKAQKLLAQGVWGKTCESSVTSYID